MIKNKGIKYIQHSKMTEGQRELAEHMSAMSEEWWSAGWSENLEYQLWGWLRFPEDIPEDRRVPTFLDDMIELKSLMEREKGWVIMDAPVRVENIAAIEQEVEHYFFLDMAEWEKFLYRNYDKDLTQALRMIFKMELGGHYEIDQLYIRQLESVFEYCVGRKINDIDGWEVEFDDLNEAIDCFLKHRHVQELGLDYEIRACWKEYGLDPAQTLKEIAEEVLRKLEGIKT